MKRTITIGERTFASKKEAIAFYREMLNSYNSNESLNDSDFDAIIDLLKYDLSFHEHKDAGEKDKESIPDSKEGEITITDIKITEVQFKTNCFEVVYSDLDSQYISHRLIIERPKLNPFRLFSRACRTAVQKDIRSVKQAYFDKHSVKGVVPCQETGVKSSWKELAVDHRQPNTFSVIVDRFIEINQLNIESIEYSSNENNEMIFKDYQLSERFRLYHKEKSTLRIIRKEANSKRATMAKLKLQKNDLQIGQLDFFSGEKNL